MLDRRISYDPAFASDTVALAEPLPIEAPALRRRPVYEFTKRAVDILLSFVALTALTPVFLAVALAIKLDSRGPVFYRQTRMGKDAKPFTMLKFRSMFHRPIDLPPELLAHNESNGPLFKMRNDPRVTRVGRLIRRASIDELPQLINVLWGHMSLVGPRPPLPREFEGFETVQRLRLRVVPGVTGPWQVSGRSNLPFEEMVRLDLGYIERRSLLLDLKLLLLTVPTVLLGRGAY
jgi:lipopolysaccharide/colanic/teichoic acid biosynthesis glycosyltransferase